MSRSDIKIELEQVPVVKDRIVTATDHKANLTTRTRIPWDAHPEYVEAAVAFVREMLVYEVSKLNEGNQHA
jgi:hypothetical protein